MDNIEEMEDLEPEETPQKKRRITKGVMDLSPPKKKKEVIQETHAQPTEVDFTLNLPRIETEVFFIDNHPPDQQIFVESAVNLEDEPQAIPKIGTYERNRKAESLAWSSLRQELNKVGQEIEAPMTNKCISCKKIPKNVVRCSDCGPHVFMCEVCIETHHKHIHFHVPELWNGFSYSRYSLESKALGKNAICDCIQEIHYFTYIDCKGRHHDAKIEVCPCEKIPVSLLRYNIWSASPKSPKVGIDIELLHHLKALQLESHISSKSFFDSLSYLHRHQKYSKDQYKVYKAVVTESIPEFMYYSYYKESLEAIAEYKMFKTCPYADEKGCYKTLIMDGNFSCVRKKTSGRSTHPARLSHQRVFVEDSVRDEFFSKNSSDAPLASKTCSEFSAGELAEKKQKYAGLDVTGVFGSCCSHDYPLKLIDMTSGERLGYAQLMIQQLIPETNTFDQINVIYDIACKLKPSTEKSIPSLSNLLKMIIPVWHGYSHTRPECQTDMNARNVEGLGLIDGEALERFWSYLGKFCSITKEQTPENRHDTLSHAVIHHRMKVVCKTATALVDRKMKAERVKTACEKKLTELMPNYQLSSIRTKAEKWYKEEKDKLKNRPVTSLNSWKEEYAIKVVKYLKLQSEKNSQNELELTRLNGNLEKIEKQRHVKRWTLKSREAKPHIQSAVSKTRQTILIQLAALTGHYRYLCSNKKMYQAGYRSIATLMTKQIESVSKKVSKLIDDYNQMSSVTVKDQPSFLSRLDVIKEDSPLWDGTQDASPQNIKVKRQVIKEAQLLSRSEEEAVNVQNDAEAALCFFTSQQQILVENIKAFETKECTQQERGLLSMLNTELSGLESFITYVIFTLDAAKFDNIKEIEYHSTRSNTSMKSPDEEECYIMNELNRMEESFESDLIEDIE